MEAAMSGMQSPHLRPRCRLKAKASYVDETLFASPAGTRPAPPDFDPPWAQRAAITRGKGPEAAAQSRTPALTPRKKNKYRLVGHTPSYCDESLFGCRPAGSGWEAPWMVKGDAAKLHALFWTPPATPRGGRSPRPRGTPLRAVHPAGAPGTGPAPDPAGARPPERRGRSHSLHPPGAPGTPLAAGDPASGPSASGGTSRAPRGTPRARPASVSAPATPKPKPPWR